MNARQRAELLDAQNRPLEAAEAYESAIRDPHTDLDAFLNLAVLYLEFADFGFAAHHRIPDEYIRNSFSRAQEVLAEAERRFGKHSEISFWQRYLRFVVLGEEPFEEECTHMVNPNESLVPYFYLYSAPGGEKYQQQAEQLLAQVGRGTTQRERYIKSIIEPRLRKWR